MHGCIIRPLIHIGSTAYEHSHPGYASFRPKTKLSHVPLQAMRLLAAWDDVLPLYSRTYFYQTGTLATPSPSMDTASLLALARGPQLSSAFYFKTSSNLHMHIPLPSNLGRIHGRAMSRLIIQDKTSQTSSAAPMMREIRSSQPGKINRKAALNSLHPCEPRRRRRVLDPSFSDSALCYCPSTWNQ